MRFYAKLFAVLLLAFFMQVAYEVGSTIQSMPLTYSSGFTSEDAAAVRDAEVALRCRLTTTRWIVLDLMGLPIAAEL